MPYLNYLFCEECKGFEKLDLDFFATLETYKKEGRKSVFINEKTIIWDYLVYVCYNCKVKYKYTYKDVERRVREYFCALSGKHKEIFEALAKKQELEEQKIESRQKASEATLTRIKKTYTHKEK